MPRIEAMVAERTSFKDVSAFWYGAVDIHPKHCAIWIRVRTDAEKARINDDAVLLQNLRTLLEANGYPPEAMPHVYLGAESEETVQRESAGDWRQHFK